MKFVMVGALSFASLFTKLPELSGPDTWIFQDPSPPGGLFFSRTLTSAVFDPGSNRMIVFGGLDGDDISFNDVRELTNANRVGGPTARQRITLIPNGANGSPPARFGHSAVYDSANKRRNVFTGCPIGSCFSAVWIVNNANGMGGPTTWQQLFPTGTPPSDRVYFSAFYDSANNRRIVFAVSVAGSQCLPDVWVLTNANRLGGTSNWTQLSPSGEPPLGQNRVWGYDAVPGNHSSVGVRSRFLLINHTTLWAEDASFRAAPEKCNSGVSWLCNLVRFRALGRFFIARNPLIHWGNRMRQFRRWPSHSSFTYRKNDGTEWPPYPLRFPQNKNRRAVISAADSAGPAFL
jgi:hypothetical protein